MYGTQDSGNQMRQQRQRCVSIGFYSPVNMQHSCIFILICIPPSFCYKAMVIERGVGHRTTEGTMLSPMSRRRLFSPCLLPQASLLQLAKAIITLLKKSKHDPKWNQPKSLRSRTRGLSAFKLRRKKMSANSLGRAALKARLARELWTVKG
ncbi:hypothetical protein IQ07DRAFT_224173 [Pyrenochaeta sp. DS3sAY3a]|nr:hypothetical protein IQ07DRAFT_224173 [Pyrenochaeta sp. DS3sAY3a]